MVTADAMKCTIRSCHIVQLWLIWSASVQSHAWLKVACQLKAYVLIVQDRMPWTSEAKHLEDCMRLYDETMKLIQPGMEGL